MSLYTNSLNGFIFKLKYFKSFFLLFFTYNFALISTKKLKNSPLQSKDSNNVLSANKTDAEVIYYALGNCTVNNCDNCLTEKICKCPEGYAQDPYVAITNDTKSCQYKMKQQWAFFLLELIFFFGAGHFYGGRWKYGLIKFCTLLLIIIIDFSVKGNADSYKFKKKFNSIILTCYILFLFWQTTDIVLIGINYFDDGKGIKFDTLR